jgi:Dolichyl-phosphate-mannose-protein mannosyltransferase
MHPTGTHEQPPASGELAIGPLRLSRPAQVVAAASALFIALSIVWVLVDKRIPGGGDPGIHLHIASDAAELLKDVDLAAIIDLGPVGDQFFYPPLVHLIGAVPAAFGLAIQDWGTVALNLVFVPLLAAGVYLVGKRVYGPVAGMLAAIFALGTPMVLSLFHVFVLDAPLAATIAITVAALLACERFELRRPSIVAGALVGVCVLVKPAAPLYLIGPVAVMLIGGGWRQWRNLAFAGLAALIVAAPYYLVHLDQVLNLSEETTVGPDVGATGPIEDRDARISYANLSWYGWAAINQQYFVPLLALFAVGLVAAVRDLRRRHVAELLAGVLITYLALALLLSIRDARYTLPLVVYVSVIATGWIATTPRFVLRSVGLAVLALAVAANVAVSADEGPDLRRQLPGTEYELDNDPGTLTFLDDRGYFTGPPDPNDVWERLLEAAERDGLDSARLRIHTTGLWGEDPLAFDVVARQYGVREVSLSSEPPPRPDLLIDTWFESSRFTGLRTLLPPCEQIYQAIGFNGEPLLINVTARRLVPGDGYRRWCDF